jgi:bacteriocin-like protein
MKVLSKKEMKQVGGGTLWLLSWLFGGWGRKSYGGNQGGGSNCGCVH